MARFVFGCCFDGNSERLEGYRTFYADRFIVIRGAPGSKYYVCDACGSATCGWEEPPYVLRRQLGDEEVYHDASCNLYVTERLAERIDWKPFRDIELFPFPICGQPLDGVRLPGDPDWDAMGPPSEEEQRRARLLFEGTDEAAAPKARRVSRRAPRSPNPERLRKALAKRGLEAAEVAFLLSRARTGFRLEHVSPIPKPMSAIPLGGSRLGGVPDMAGDVHWPTTPTGKPLAFLAQINLEDARGVPLEEAMPEKGYLCFFYDAEDQPWGGKPDDRGSWRVLYSEARVEDLMRVDAPANLVPACQFQPQRVKLKPTLFLPSAETLSNKLNPPHKPSASPENPLRLLREALDSGEYQKWAAEANGQTEGGPDHRFLGQPQEVQFSTPATDRRLLLQLDGDGWMWGDCGKLYFWIPREDLAARRFENVWIELQCF